MQENSISSFHNNESYDQAQQQKNPEIKNFDLDNQQQRNDFQSKAFQVCVRIRPCLPKELNQLSDQNNESIIKVQNQTLWLSQNERCNLNISSNLNIHEFNFDRIFTQENTNQQLFTDMVNPLISESIKGYNQTILAYGMTGAGKTYTIFGQQKEKGIMTLLVEQLFDQLVKTNDDFTINVSLLELYNEQLRDLLLPNTPAIQLQEDPQLGVLTPGLT